IFTFQDRFQLHVHFEAFNMFNQISDTAVSTQAYRAGGGVLNPIAGLGTGTSSGGFPDGTNARRAQVSIRFVF
ncbi:MAG: hypothetical protein ABIG68_00905, partial [Acidobacteriota bacterium]